MKLSHLSLAVLLVPTLLVCAVTAGASEPLDGFTGRSHPGGRCLTAEPGFGVRALATRPPVLYFTPEVQRSLAAGAKQVRVSGDVPEPGTEALARVVDDGYSLLVGQIGFPSFPNVISVGFAELPAGADGFVVGDRSGLSARIVLSRSLSGDALVSALAHQIGHLAALSYPEFESGWWAEATALWVQSQLLEDDQRFADALLRTRLTAPATTVGEGGQAAHAVTWLWYLENRFDPTVIREIWERAASDSEQSVIAATRDVVGGRRSSLERELEGHAAWLIAEARRADLKLSFARHASRFPVSGYLVDDGPGPLGTSYLQFQTSNIAGGLVITIESERPMAVAAALVPSGGYLPTARVSFSAQEGRTTLSVPTSDIGEVIVSVTSLDDVDDDVLAFSYSATIDDRYPYVLSRFDADPEGDGVRVSWETETEREVFGWSVRRSSASGRAFGAVNTVMLPGGGALGIADGAEYELFDDDVRPGQTYYYFVRGLTNDGLPASSHFVSVTTPH